ncbi:unnamed protein product [Eruca vesicaria subsp. sativa]|uniref:NECAP PHear domain-containing protein n=1 Tax=Eruca vesicaria subsp. sativa TaxID=29727 RepID=A0ABC8J1A6_ERUVS|nr:unnamed protein product [Eruca vesicaria subsp. sativa]
MVWFRAGSSVMKLDVQRTMNQDGSYGRGHAPYLLKIVPFTQSFTDQTLKDMLLFLSLNPSQVSVPSSPITTIISADEWDVNKWAWEGELKVVRKGEECIIKLVDKTTGELYAQAFLRDGEPYHVEAVIDSSRYFVLRVEEKIALQVVVFDAFIRLGLRERTKAYDFQTALHDQMKYLNKKKTADEMEKHFQNTSSIDYNLKEGETIVLQLKKYTKSKLVDKSLSKISWKQRDVHADAHYSDLALVTCDVDEIAAGSKSSFVHADAHGYCLVYIYFGCT